MIDAQAVTECTFVLLYGLFAARSSGYAGDLL